MTMCFKFRTRQELRVEILARTVDIPWTGRRKEVVRNSQLYTLKENWIPQPHRWWYASTKLVTQYSRSSVLWVVEFWQERRTETPYTSMRMLRTQNSYFERFAQQISSVSTKQSQADEEFVQKPNEKEPTSDRFVAKEKWAAFEECETARSNFFGANSKRWWSSIWKQIARMSPELRHTGEKHPIYQSLQKWT